MPAHQDVSKAKVNVNKLAFIVIDSDNGGDDEESQEMPNESASSSDTDEDENTADNSRWKQVLRTVVGLAVVGSVAAKSIYVGNLLFTLASKMLCVTDQVAYERGVVVSQLYRVLHCTRIMKYCLKAEMIYQLCMSNKNTIICKHCSLTVSDGIFP